MSVEVLKTKTPTAKKEHKCDLCSGKIQVGEKYRRTTCLFDGTVYDWLSHLECSKVSSKLDMYDRCWDDGLSEDTFREFIDEYVREKHYDDEFDDIAKDWQLPYKDLAIKILEELK